MREHSRPRRVLAAVALSTGLVAALAGCVPDEQVPMPTPTSATTASPGASAPPAVPELVPNGTATENLPFFDQINAATVERIGDPGGRDFIDALVASGFQKAAMEVTPDRTSINVDADQVQFSVRINGTCLVGQFGGDRYNGAAAPVLATGTCLIGTTRPIDW